MDHGWINAQTQCHNCIIFRRFIEDPNGIIKGSKGKRIGILKVLVKIWEEVHYNEI